MKKRFTRSETVLEASAQENRVN